MIYNLQEEKTKRRAAQNKVDIARFWTDFTYQKEDYEYSEPTSDALYYTVEDAPSLAHGFQFNRTFCGAANVR